MREMTRATTESILILGLCVVLFFFNKWLAMFVAFVTVSSLFPVFDRFAYWRREAVLFGVLWYVFISYFADKNLMFDAVCILIIINSIVAFVQLVGLDPYKIMSFGMFHSTSLDVTGLMFNKNELSAAAGVAFPLFLRRKWLKAMPAELFVLFIAKSTTGIAAAGVSFGVYLLYERVYWPFIPVVLCGILYVTFWDTGNMSALNMRLGWLKTAFRILRDHPLGIGAGHWHLAANQLHAHNDFAQIAVESGLHSLIVIYVFTVTLFLKADIMGKAIISGIAVTSLISFMWFIPTTALIMTTLLAVVGNERFSINCIKSNN